MNRELLDKWCERGILGLVLAILVFGPLATGAVRTPDFLVIQGLTVGVILLWGVRLWLSPKPRFLWPPISWAVIAFAGYAVARYFVADIEYVARQEMIRVIVYSFLFLAIVNNLHRQESIQIITITMVFLAMAISFYAIYQFAASSDHVWTFIKPYPHRGSGTYISPNHLGGFLEMLLPLALTYTLAGRFKHLTKVFLGYAALVILAGIAVTVSRGSWISTSLSLLVLFALLLTQRGYRLQAVACLLVLLIIGCIAAPRSHWFRVRAKALVLADGTLDDDARYEVWRPAIKIWQENLWWGAGPGHFDSRFDSFRPESIQAAPVRAHNDYLNTLADWGIVGSAIIGAALLLLGVGVVKTWSSVRGSQRDIGEKRNSNKFSLVLGSGIGLLAIMAHSMVDFNMHIPANAILAVALMAFLSSHLRFATDNYWFSSGLMTKLLATALIIASGVYFVRQGWRRANEYAWLKRAANASVYSPEQVQMLTRAFQIEPGNSFTALRIGEALRVQSGDGGSDYRELAGQAMEWFDRSQKLNPWNSYGFLRYGMCLDWLERPGESGPYFQKAEQLDPNGYATMEYIGTHYIALGNYAGAKPWFERSLRLQWHENDIAHKYLAIVNARLEEAATNEISAKLQFPSGN